MQYRIVKRKDSVLNEYRYYLHRRSHWWNNWIEIGDRCVTMESAELQVQCYLDEKEVVRYT